VLVAPLPVVVVWDVLFVELLPLSSPPLATATTMATTATRAAAASSPIRWFLDMTARKYG
jgi:hypothetical protein